MGGAPQSFMNYEQFTDIHFTDTIPDPYVVLTCLEHLENKVYKV